MVRASLALVLLCATGCGGVDARTFEWMGSEHRVAGLGPLRLRWNERLTSEYGGAYKPVERSIAALDPARNRIFVGSTAGRLIAYDPAGKHLYEFDAGGGIQSEPALDPARDELYFGSEEGQFFSLVASTGKERWRQRVDGAVRQLPVLTADTVFIVTEGDTVLALAREDGTVLWRYQREAPETMSISAHAGLLFFEGRLYTGFTDGVVVALVPSDGTVVWERDTSIDVNPDDSRAPRFVDVDTTPVAVGREVWVASFAGGLYGLAAATGSVEWREQDRKGITDLTVDGDRVYAASGDDGVVCMSADTHGVLWKHPSERGNPTRPVLVDSAVIVAEKGGPLLVLDAERGREVNRIETGYGFTSPPAVADGRGFILSNGGTLFAFALTTGDDADDARE